MPARLRVERIEYGCRPFRWLKEFSDRPYPVLLESAQHGTALGRYSLLCWSPQKRLTCRNGAVEVRDVGGGSGELYRGDPFDILSEQFRPHRIETSPGFDLPFAGGAVGFFSYDLRHRIENLPRTCDYDLDIPEFILCFYDRGIVFDHEAGVTWYVGPGGSSVPRASDKSTVKSARAFLPPVAGVELGSNFTPDEYRAAVQRVKDYIAAGDIFQANLSQRFEAPAEADGLTLYERLRAINPAPFAAYLRYPGFEIMSSSPERFLELEGDLVVTRPIKGTRPRRKGDRAFNRRMRAELLASEKDHAELAMIVDLERNDLGRVCRYGSVRVAEHAVLETYPTVYHLVSTVRGQLFRQNHDEFDLIRATFPGGSITGAPKIRAMEIIEELEPHARSVYTGSIGYISFHGRMDLNIVIRTLVKCGGRVYGQFGGGIVADSDPALEYEETIHKGRALFKTLNATNLDQILGASSHGARVPER
jgi:para-aminobenzoate synthetase component 1